MEEIDLGGVITARDELVEGQRHSAGAGNREGAFLSEIDRSLGEVMASDMDDFDKMGWVYALELGRANMYSHDLHFEGIAKAASSKVRMVDELLQTPGIPILRYSKPGFGIPRMSGVYEGAATGIDTAQFSDTGQVSISVIDGDNPRSFDFYAYEIVVSDIPGMQHQESLLFIGEEAIETHILSLMVDARDSESKNNLDAAKNIMSVLVGLRELGYIPDSPEINAYIAEKKEEKLTRGLGVLTREIALRPFDIKRFVNDPESQVMGIRMNEVLNRLKEVVDSRHKQAIETIDSMREPTY